MKLVIQIPCYNEEQSLASALASLPRQIPGIREVEILVIDDGSGDRTVDVARQSGASVHSLGTHQGLAAAFSAGIREAVLRGADIVVNTDADNQYEAADIPALIQPILAGEKDLVLGDREVGTEEYFSPAKRLLQSFGSRVVSMAVGAKIPDATTGFRAFSRTAAAQVLVLSKFSYTLETLIQAGALKHRIGSIPIRTNAPVRPSRLMRSKLQYVRRSAFIILRSFALYHPFKTLLSLTGIFSLIAIAAFAGGSQRLLAFAAVSQSVALLGFVPLYFGHQAIIKKVEEQSSRFNHPAARTVCATAKQR